MSRVIVRLLLVLVLVMICFIGFNVTKPRLEIIIDNEIHNPLDTSVFINGIKVAPTGNGGKMYSLTIKNGKNTVEIKGPFIKNYSSEVTASLLDKKSLTIKTEDRTAEEIIAESVDANEARISQLEVFRESSAIVVYVNVEGQIDDDGSFPSLFLYNNDSAKWEEISEKYIENRSAYTIDSEVLNYFSEISND